MATLHHVWDFIVFRWFEIVLALGAAVVAAIVVGVFFELLDIGSRLRAGIRHLKNKRSERSATRLLERITQLEKQRDSYAAYSRSDKAHYLATFNIVIGILVSIAIAAGLGVLNGMMRTFPPFGVLSIFFYFVAVVGGIQGIKTASLDTREKVSEAIAKLESEITELRKKLESRKRE